MAEPGASGPVDDLTRRYDYARLVAEEREHYGRVEVTATLDEGGVHAHASWQHYWRRVEEAMRAAGGADLVTAIAAERPLHVLSLGSGYCGRELALAALFPAGTSITCTDVNPALFDRARAAADAKGLDLRFREADMNFLEIEPAAWDLVIAQASLHHVINLERLFAQVARGLAPGGRFHVVEVIGRNRRLLWPANARFANRALRLVPRAIVGFARVRTPLRVHGMEGLRQEEIVPLLHRTFVPVFEHRHGAFMRFVCTHPRLGKRLDPGDAVRRRYLDLLIDVDRAAVANGILRPLELWGIYRAPG